MSAIGILGGGGIGSWYAAILSRAGHDVTMLTRGAHLDAIRANGLQVKDGANAYTATVRATDDPRELAGVEWVMVATKGYSLAEVAPAAAIAARSGAAVVPLLNGVDAAERLAAANVPRDAILGGLATISVARTAPGVVEHWSAFDRTVIGAFAGSPPSLEDRARAIVEHLRAAGSESRVSLEIEKDLWRKFVFIVPMTVGCGLARTSMGPVLASEEGRTLIARAIAEVVAVGAAAGGFLDADDERRTYQGMLNVAPGMKPSLLLDLERGSVTEVDTLGGTVSRMGRELGVPTPVCDVATAAFIASTIGAKM
jgi:2-dehydropantoate 2-reductase